ncbi:MAG: flavodoxin-dependent (E)-4-hydroxy-3-methylbut-2-enyl-diphosphate synthase [Erysipelotrichaceae bacterium]|nr:flavodoxin-dependent (E)-4-hydroxy-3-methylbut-2-enyl-diphosphate synthase [Erysipelotrichaceae bacterium]
MNKREKTRTVRVGDLTLGGQDRVIIQSMTNTKTHDVEATVAQIERLEKAGCEIVRVACLQEEDALAIAEIKKRIHIPIVADIHFNPDFAIKAIENGVDKIRLNPGNIEDESKIRTIVELAKKNGVPIRIGINSGSLNKKYEHSTDAMIASAYDHLRILEDLDFHDVVLSFKSSDALETIEVYRKAAETFPYPLHLGVTEAGPLVDSSIKSAFALGTLLNEGIGDTIRVSISDDPVKEIAVAKKLLRTVGLRKDVPTLISCPTCGRIQYDMLPIVAEIEEYLSTVNKDIKVAIMGCAVNGPGEASAADIGVAGGKESALLFKKGKIVRSFPQEEIVQVLKAEIDKF